MIQHVRVRVRVPKKIDDEERELLTKLLELEGNKSFDDEKGFMDKVKDIFS